MIEKLDDQWGLVVFEQVKENGVFVGCPQGD